MNAASSPSPRGRSLIDTAGCLAIAASAHSAIQLGLAVPVATLTLFGAMACASVLRRAFTMAPAAMRYEVPLSLGLILLGVQLRPAEILKLGATAPLWIIGYQLAVTSLLLLALSSKVAGLRARGMIAMGLSGAGLASVLAVQRADPKAPSHVTPIVLSCLLTTGAIGFVELPYVGAALKLDAAVLSQWAGIVMPSTTEAVLIGKTHSEEALRLTAAWRLLINLLQWIPIALYLACFAPRQDSTRGLLARSFSIGKSTMRGIPMFVWGLGIVGAFSCTEGFSPSERAALARLTYWSLLTALAGIGWNTRPRALLSGNLGTLGVMLAVWATCTLTLLALL